MGTRYIYEPSSAKFSKEKNSSERREGNRDRLSKEEHIYVDVQSVSKERGIDTELHNKIL